MMYDALGNEIIIGKSYGMSRNSNGHTNIVIGNASKFSETKVTLDITKRMNCIYSDAPREARIDSKKVSVLGSALFPICHNPLFNGK